MVQRLLHVGADIHARDKDSLTPIYLAGRKRNAVIARILLSVRTTGPRCVLPKRRRRATRSRLPG
jgi:hypothetical protein